MSLIAAAQSNPPGEQKSTDSNKKIVTPRDAASGQASGKMSNGGAEQAPALRESPTKPSSNLRESPSKASLGKTSVADTNGDGQANRESSAASVSEIVVTKPSDKRVAAGDVNGDGRADVANGPRQSTSQDGAINTSHSNIKNTKDTATGQATGKRQYAPVELQKEAAPAKPEQ